MDARTCVSDLARYTEFLWEEDRRIEHAKSLTAAASRGVVWSGRGHSR